jgi:hypothetical protein
MSARVSDTDHGYAELIKRTIGMKPVVIATGLLAKDGAASAEGSPLTLLEIAVINHFGSSDGHVPSRPWITGWFDENEPKLREMLTSMMRQAVKGELTRQQVLDRMGQYCVGSIQQHIANHVLPENAPSTVARKKSSTPLVNKGQLRSAMSYEIREGGSE